MEDRKTYVDKLTAQLKEWDAKIDELEAKTEKAQADMKLQYQEKVDKLKSKRKEADNKLKELKQAGDSAG